MSKADGLDERKVRRKFGDNVSVDTKNRNVYYDDSCSVEHICNERIVRLEAIPSFEDTKLLSELYEESCYSLLIDKGASCACLDESEIAKLLKSKLVASRICISKLMEELDIDQYAIAYNTETNEYTVINVIDIRKLTNLNISMNALDVDKLAVSCTRDTSIKIIPRQLVSNRAKLKIMTSLMEDESIITPYNVHVNGWAVYIETPVSLDNDCKLYRDGIYVN
jgi:hypothetical protein